MASVSSTQIVMTNVWKLRLVAMLSGLKRAPKIPTIIQGILLAFGLFGQWIAPHDPITIDLAKSFTPPVWHAEGSASNLLGTDKLGRDILSRVIIGSRVSLALSLTIILSLIHI